MTDEQDTPETKSDGESDGETQSSMSRWWLTNDALAAVLVVAMALLVLGRAAGVAQVPASVVQAFVAYTGVAIVWLFGRGAAKLIFGER